MFYAGSLYKGVCGIIFKGVEQFTVQGLELRIRSFRVLGKRNGLEGLHTLSVVVPHFLLNSCQLHG